MIRICSLLSLLLFSFNKNLDSLEKNVLINDINEPYKIEEITKIIGLEAYDYNDGDITSKIIIETDGYSANASNIGEYSLVFKVTNSRDFSINYEVIIKNMDLQAPIISGPENLTLSYKTKNLAEEILKNYQIEDKIDNKLTVSLLNYEETQKYPIGEYKFTLRVIDKSLNEAKKEISVSIIDDIKPWFVGEEYLKVIMDDHYSINYFENLKAYDEIDGDITENIKILKDNLKDKEGIYEVVYEVFDKKGNGAKFNRNYEITTNKKKIILYLENNVRIETDELTDLILKNYEKIITEDDSIISKYKDNVFSLIINENSEREKEYQIEVIGNNTFRRKNIDRVLNVLLIINGLLVSFKIYKKIKKKRKE